MKNTTERFDWAPVLAVSIALFVVTIDTTIMNVAITAVVRELNTSVTTVQAAISIFPMVMASLVLTGSRIGERYGVRRWLTVGMFTFGIGGLVAAFSPTVEILALGWSIIEGIGAALILPLGYALLYSTYAGRQRTVAFGVLGGVMASGAAFGPIVGGFLTTFLTWRIGFGLHIVWISLAYFVFLRRVADIPPRKEKSLDWVGTFLSVLGIASIVLGSILAGKHGWWEARRAFKLGGLEIAPFGLSVTPFLIAIGLIVLTALVHWQGRRERQGLTPLFSVSLLRNGQFMASATTDTVRQLYIAGMVFVVPLFLQSALGYNALESGLALLPFSLMGLLAAFGTARLSERFAAKHLIQAGMVVTVLGFLLLYNVTSLSLTMRQMIIPLGVIGLGLGVTVAQMVDLTLSTVKRDSVNEASGVSNTFRELGNALGTAVIGSLLLSFFYGGVVDGVLRAEDIRVTPAVRETWIVGLEDITDTLTPQQASALVSQLPAETQRGLTTIVNGSVVAAQQDTLLAIAAFILLSLLLSTFLPVRGSP